MPSRPRSLLKALIARVRASIRVEQRKLRDTTYAEIRHALYRPTLAAEIGYSLERRGNEEKFQAIFHHSSEAILLFDDTGIIDCNQATLDIFACPDRALLLGHHPAEFSPELQPDGMPSCEKRRLHEHAVLEHGTHRFEWMFRDFPGRIFPLEVNLTRVTLAGRVAFMGLFHNIERRKAYERELERAKQQAESANQAKGAFIVRVSQQIRPPLNGILQAARFLLESDLRNQQRVLVESVENTSRDVLTLLNDALDLFRMQAGDLRLECAPFDLRLAIEDVVELLSPKADAKGIDLVLHYSCLLPRRAVGDAGRVRQILIHTVEHAILRTDQGHVAIHLEALPVPADRFHLAFTIEDTGMAIPTEQRGALFEGLNDLDSANPSCSGKGLGLTLAGKLVEYMGGTLSLTSEAGRGNRLAYEILLDRDADEWPARRPSAAALDRRVLLVGPDNLVRAGLVQTLRDWGLDPRVASSAEEALPCLTRDNIQAPDLVLVSNRLSGMSWEEFGRRVIDVMGEARPALVLCVRFSETILSGAAMEAGWDSVTVRNVRMASLLDLLERTHGANTATNQTTVSSSLIRKTVLLATDDPDTFSNVSALARAYNLSCDRAGSLEAAVELAKQRRHDLAIVDFTQGPEQLPRAVKRIRTSLLDCTIPIVVAAPARVLLPGCECLIKPIRTPELDRLLFRLISGPAVPVFNQSEFIARCGGDREMAGDLSATFRRLLPSLMSRLMESTGTQNAAAVLGCARRMRAAAAMFSAVPLIRACERLSNVTEIGDWGSAPAVASVVKAEAGRLAVQLPMRAVCEEIPV